MADLTVTPANVIQGTGAVLLTGVAGETLLAGQVVYLKSSDGRVYKAECDVNAESATFLGIAMHGATVGQPVVYQTAGELNIGATTIKTTTYMISAAAGGICPQADLVSTNRITIVGLAKDTTGTLKLVGLTTGVAV